MQIEESFRDNKNQRIGLSLKETKSRNEQRLQVLLLIIAIATLLLWLVGKAAIQQARQTDYQANTVSIRRVLSLFNLGLQVLRKEPDIITKHELSELFQQLAMYTKRIQLE